MYGKLSTFSLQKRQYSHRIKGEIESHLVRFFGKSK
jgi:hypothetical protein